MVYYLKYRPQTLDELIGQEVVASTLKKALENNKLSHAYLFVGPRGVGKTSTARILAKMVNCPKGGCNKCDICRSITDGSNMDLIEIDAASNRGIEDIRDLRDKIKLSPSFLKKKVYIIDEVHMLTSEAFNALLKTLEEPPEHALFILATTEVNKVPQTILSRTTRLDFKEAGGEDLIKAFKKIALEEKLQVDDEALNLLAKKSEGSFRDGVKLLDQISAISPKIGAKLIQETLKETKLEEVLELIGFINSKDTSGAIKKSGQILREGVRVKDLFYSLMDTLRSMLLIKYSGLEEESGVYTKEQTEELKTLGERFSSEEIIKLLNNLQKGYEDLKFASISELPLEVAIIESTEQVTGNRLQVTVEQPKSEENVIVQTPETSQTVQAPQQVEDSGVNPSSPDMLTLKDKWSYILEMVKPYNFSLEALLRQVKIASAKDNQVILKVPYSFHQRILETPRNRDLLESVLTDVLGKNIKIATVLESRPVRVEELANVEVAADDEVIKIAAEIFNS